jgi:uncharacterized protein YggT (Ycf19 family)
MKCRENNDPYYLYNENTEPALVSITQPIPLSAYQLQRPSWFLRAIYAIGNFFAAIIRKINQLLAFALAVLLLLLFTRFLLLFFSLSLSDFAHWIFWLSTPLVAPFEHLVPALPYHGYIIDISTLISIVAYAMAVTIVRQFLKLLITR